MALDSSFPSHPILQLLCPLSSHRDLCFGNLCPQTSTFLIFPFLPNFHENRTILWLTPLKGLLSVVINRLVILTNEFMLRWMNLWFTPLIGIPCISIGLFEVLMPAMLKVFYLEGCHKRHNLLSNSLSSCHQDHIPNTLSVSFNILILYSPYQSSLPPLPSMAGLLTLPWTHHVFSAFCVLIHIIESNSRCLLLSFPFFQALPKLYLHHIPSGQRNSTGLHGSVHWSPAEFMAIAFTRAPHLVVLELLA